LRVDEIAVVQRLVTALIVDFRLRYIGTVAPSALNFVQRPGARVTGVYPLNIERI
jgi:hypothetical protein